MGLEVSSPNRPKYSSRLLYCYSNFKNAEQNKKEIAFFKFDKHLQMAKAFELVFLLNSMYPFYKSIFEYHYGKLLISILI